MSQLFDYFVCSRKKIEQWGRALEEQDEEIQEHIEGQMARRLCLKNISMVEFSILAHCVDDAAVDVVQAATEVDEVLTVNEEEGPWVMAFRPDAVQAVAKMTVDPSLVERWVNAVTRFNEDEVSNREGLTADLAEKFKDLCRCAMNEGLEVFVCFYG